MTVMTCRRAAPIVLGSLLAAWAPSLAGAEILTHLGAEDIRAAIAFGQTASAKELDDYELGSAPSWVVTFDTPFLRVAQLAAFYKGHKGNLGEADIPASLLASEVHVYAHARMAPDVAMPNVTYLRILKKTADRAVADTILPLSYDTFVRRVPTSEGDPTRLGHSFKSVFPVSALKAGYEMRVLFETGEEEFFKIDGKALSAAR